MQKGNQKEAEVCEKEIEQIGIWRKLNLLNLNETLKLSIPVISQLWISFLIHLQCLSWTCNLIKDFWIRNGCHLQCQKFIWFTSLIFYEVIDLLKVVSQCWKNDHW